jgi:hypothetical protein
VGDIGDANGLRQVLADARRGDRPLLVYARFLLHCLPADEAGTLLTVVAEATAPGDLLAVEFRTDRDSGNPKAHQQPYRRYVNARGFVESLQARYHFRVELRQEGNGFSRYHGEDPDLCRIVARRVPAAEAAALPAPKPLVVKPSSAALAPPPPAPAATPQPGRRQRVMRRVVRDYAPPAFTRWLRARRARRASAAG